MKKILCIGVGLITEHFIKCYGDTYNVHVIVRDPMTYTKIGNESVFGPSDLPRIICDMDIIMNTVVDSKFNVDDSYDKTIVDLCNEHNIRPVHILLGSRKQNGCSDEYTLYKNKVEDLYRGQDCVVLRLPNVYGDSRNFLRKNLFIPRIISSARDGELHFDISLRSTKVFVHVTDVCQAIHTLLMHKVYNQTVAVGGENVSVESIINVIQSKRKVRVIQTNERVDSFTVDDTFIRSIGWYPHKDFVVELSLLLDKYLDSI